MGLWEWICRAAVAVKRCKSRVKPVTEVCKKGFDVSRAAKAQMDGAVKTKAREIHDFLSDDQVRDHLTRLLKHLSKNGALFVVRSYGGGPIIDIVSQSIQDRNADSQTKRLQELELKVAKLEWELRSRKETIGKPKLNPKYNNTNKHNFNAYMNPNQDDILRVVLMKHLVKKVLDELTVPTVRYVKPKSGIDRHYQ